MVLRGSPGTIWSQIFRRSSSFQKSVSKRADMGWLFFSLFRIMTPRRTDVLVWQSFKYSPQVVSTFADSFTDSRLPAGCPSLLYHARIEAARIQSLWRLE